jgi:predicted HAD superfamily hydrolase
MKTELLLEEERDKLKTELMGNLKKKQVLELEISKQFEQLKNLEITMEKNVHVPIFEKGQPLIQEMVRK